MSDESPILTQMFVTPEDYWAIKTFAGICGRGERFDEGLWVRAMSEAFGCKPGHHYELVVKRREEYGSPIEWISRARFNNQEII